MYWKSRDAPHIAFTTTAPPQIDRKLQIVRVADMYGYCKCIKAYSGSDAFGDSHYDAYNKVWLVDYVDRDGCGVEATIPVVGDDHEASMIEVETFFRDAYRANYSMLAEVA
jgi:hypothetical protein